MNYMKDLLLTIKTHPLSTLLIIFSIIFATFIFVVLIKKLTLKLRSKSKATKSTTNIIKTAKKLIKKNRLKSKLSQLYIFYGNSTAAKNYLIKTGVESNILTMNDFTYIAIDKYKPTLLVDYKNIKNIKKIKRKLKLQFQKLTICFDISENSYYDEGQIKYIFEMLSGQQFKNTVISFHSDSSIENLNNFNNTIGKNNTFKITKDQEKDTKIDEILATKILNKSDDISNKYLNLKLLNCISKIISNIYPELQNNNKDMYIFFKLNEFCNLSTKQRTSLINSPSLFITNLVLVLFSTIFIINIFQQIELKGETSFKNKGNLTNEKLSELLEQFRKKIDNTIIFSNIYPKSIKYHDINQQYANFILKNIISNNFNEVKDLPNITIFLLFFEYMDNNHIDDNTTSIINIISAINSISPDQLTYVIKYTSSSEKNKAMKLVSEQINKLYSSGNIVVKDTEAEVYSSTKGFNLKYLGISDTQRAKLINKIYKMYLYRCATNKVIPEIKEKFEIPGFVNKIFSLYQHHYNPQSERKLCNSYSMDTLTQGISIVFNEESNYYKKYESFSSMLQNINNIIKSLEKNDEKIVTKNKDLLQNVTISLVKYVLNDITNSTYNYKELPLTQEVPKELYMKFKPNLYDKDISISPIYSKEYIKDNIIPLNTSLNNLLKDLKEKYHIHPDFIVSIYKDSINRYKENYINSYNSVINNLNNYNLELESRINNEETLSLYLSVMASKESSFNHLIEFYKENTNLLESKQTKASKKNTTKNKKIEHKEKDNNKIETQLYESISDYFIENNNYFSSKKFQQYGTTFEQLRQLIKEHGYTKTLETIKKGYKPLKETYSNISSIKNSGNKNNLYLLLKTHLDVAIKGIEKIAMSVAIANLDELISVEYSNLNNLFPFNINSSKTISNKLLTKQLDNFGSIYSNMNKYLKPLLSYDKTNDGWYYQPSDVITEKQESYINKFNKVYHLNKSLWDTKGNPKAIDFKINPIPSNDNNYTFFSLALGENSFVNSLNIFYSSSTKLAYKWDTNPTMTITLKLENNDVAQKSYTGSWSILKAIKDAKCKNNICTWELNYKGKSYPVSFEIKSQFLDTLKQNKDRQ